LNFVLFKTIDPLEEEFELLGKSEDKIYLFNIRLIINNINKITSIRGGFKVR